MLEFEAQEISLSFDGYDDTGGYWGTGQRLWWVCVNIPEEGYRDHYQRANSAQEAIDIVRGDYNA